MNMLSTDQRRSTVGLAILAAFVAITISASQAWASVPHTTTGVISACYNSTGALRVIDTQQGATCAAGETPLSWNATPITATRWNSGGAVFRLAREGGIHQVVYPKPGSPIPAGSWMVTATVLISNSEGMSTFRCWTRTRGTLITAGHSQQDWAGVDGAHQTITVPGMITMSAPDWIDVVCSHDQSLHPTAGYVQVEGVDVMVQRVASTF